MEPQRADRDDERVSLHPLDPVTAMKALVAVKPDEPARDAKPQRGAASDKRATPRTRKRG